MVNDRCSPSTRSFHPGMLTERACHNFNYKVTSFIYQSDDNRCREPLFLRIGSTSTVVMLPTGIANQIHAVKHPTT